MKQTPSICLLFLAFSAANIMSAGNYIFDKKPSKPLNGLADKTKETGPKPEIHLEFEEIHKGMTTDSGNAKTTVQITNAQLVAGKIGKALDFNGEDNLTVIDTDLTQIAPTSYTIAVWVMPHSQKGYGLIFGSGDKRGIQLRLQNLLIDLNAGNEWHLLNAPLPNEEWTHVAATYDGENAQLYINGVLSGEKQASYPLQYSKQVFIGQFPEAVRMTNSDAKIEEIAQYLQGSLDDLRFYDSVLSAKEIETLAKIH